MARTNSGAPTSSLSTPRLVVSPWIVLIVVALGFFMNLLDVTIVNVAIPSIITALHASLDQILWVLNAYILVYAVLLITAGRLGDMYGPKKMFILGLVIFTLASAACGLAQDPNQLIVFRVIQGLGGALLTPQSLSIITSIFPPEKRGAAFGIWGAVAGVAAIAGPTLGGFLTTSLSWRAIFYVNVPIGIIAVVLAYLVMPELTVHRRHHLDLPGMALVSLALFTGIFGLIEGQRYHWGPVWDAGSFSIGSIHASIVSIPTLLVFSVIMMAIFIWTEAREDEPLLPLRLFHDRNYSVANLLIAVVSFGMLGLFLPMTIFLQSVLGLDAMHAGVVFVPMSVVSMLIAPFSGRLTDTISGKYILFVGLILFAAGMLLVVHEASLTSTGLAFTPALVIAGIGMGMTFAPMMSVAMRNIAPSEAGTASGFINTTRQVGGAVGSAVVGAILENRLASELHSQAVHYATQLPPSVRKGFIDAFSHTAKSGLEVGRGQGGAAASVPTGVPASVAHQLALLGKAVFDHAFLNAMKPALALAMAVMLAGSALTFLMQTSRQARAAAEDRQPAQVAVGE